MTICINFETYLSPLHNLLTHLISDITKSPVRIPSQQRCSQLNSCRSSISCIVETLIVILNSDGKQLQELLDQVRQRATAAEEALEAAEERSEKYRAMIDEANIELNQFKEKV